MTQHNKSIVAQNKITGDREHEVYKKTLCLRNDSTGENHGFLFVMHMNAV